MSTASKNGASARIDGRMLWPARLGARVFRTTMARLLGFHYCTLWRWETGRTRPTREQAAQYLTYCKGGLELWRRDVLGLPLLDREAVADHSGDGEDAPDDGGHGERGEGE